MDPAQIERIRSSYESLKPQWDKVINRCFDRLFIKSGNLRDLFPGDLAPVRKAFGEVIAQCVENADSLSEMEERLAELGRRHRAYGAEVGHYPLMRDALAAGLKDVAGKDWDFQVEFAWKAFMNEIAKIMHYGKASTPAPSAGGAAPNGAESAAAPAPEPEQPPEAPSADESADAEPPPAGDAPPAGG